MLSYGFSGVQAEYPQTAWSSSNSSDYSWPS